MKKTKSLSEKTKSLSGKTKSLFGKTKKGYAGLLKCNGCGKILTRDRIGAMCGPCYNERIAVPHTWKLITTGSGGIKGKLYIPVLL